MTENVFYSWQSDRPNNLCRGFIKKALEAAISELNADVQEADRPDESSLALDHDTKDLPGSPDIASSILRKIELAKAFVADVTPIGFSDARHGGSQKHLPNPNVMIELGYAKSALGTERIIQVWNTAFTNCGPTDLPFDMRGRKGPVAYSLGASDSPERRKECFTTLVKHLKSAIAATLATWPAPNLPERWTPSHPHDRSIWAYPADGMLVNEPDHGSGIKTVFPPPRSYVRILPLSWPGLVDAPWYDTLLGVVGGMSCGETTGGLVTYPGSVLYPETAKVAAITKRFAASGEVWATRTEIAAMYGDHMCIRGDSVPEDWAKYLRYAVPQMADRGAQLPFQVRIGVSGMEGLHWPTKGSRGSKPHAALENELELTFELKSIDSAELWAAVLQSWKRYRRIFSLPEPSMPEMQSVRMFLNT